MPIDAFPGLLKDAFDEWNRDKAPRLGAAIAYYAIFSVAPLLVVIIAIAGSIYGQQAAQGQIVAQIQGIVGDQSAQLIETMINASRTQAGSILAAAIGIASLVLGALGLFGALQDALNTIWEVQPKPGRGIIGLIKDRLPSLLLVLVAGSLLLEFLVAGAVLQTFGSYLNSVLPGVDVVVSIATLLVSGIAIIVLVAMIYRFLPDARIAWRDVWVGAILTTVLFGLGRLLIGIYLARTSVGSAYGAAGSLIIILVWIYYSAQIFLFGAEFTQVFARRYNASGRPADNAEAVTEEARAHQGIPHAVEPTTSAYTPALPQLHRRSHSARHTALVVRNMPMDEEQPTSPVAPVIALSAVFGLGLIAGLTIGNARVTRSGKPQDASESR